MADRAVCKTVALNPTAGKKAGPGCVYMLMLRKPRAEQFAAVVDAFFAAVSFHEGSVPAYGRLRELIVPGGQLIKNSGDAPEIATVEEFIESRQALVDAGELTSFAEFETHAITEVFGGVAHRMSTYGKHGVANGAPFVAVGVITTQFVLTPVGWLISSMAWDDERPGLDIPDRYRPRMVTQMTDADPLAADDAFFAALLAADAVALDALLGDDFAIIDVMRGAEADKAAFVAVVGGGEVAFDRIEPAERRVRLYDGTAVVTGRTAMSGSFAGAPFSAASRYTHVFVDAGDGWRLIAAQGTQIVE
jgi:ketosteroid isomerase-like protein